MIMITYFLCLLTDSITAVMNGKRLQTYELCWFIWPFVDERFESLLHGVDKLLIFQEADVDDVIYLVFKVQQLLHHCFVFFRIDYDCTSKSLDVDFLKQ